MNWYRGIQSFSNHLCYVIDIRDSDLCFLDQLVGMNRTSLFSHRLLVSLLGGGGGEEGPRYKKQPQIFQDEVCDCESRFLLVHFSAFSRVRKYYVWQSCCIFCFVLSAQCLNIIYEESQMIVICLGCTRNEYCCATPFRVCAIKLMKSREDVVM